MRVRTVPSDKIYAICRALAHTQRYGEPKPLWQRIRMWWRMGRFRIARHVTEER